MQKASFDDNRQFRRFLTSQKLKLYRIVTLYFLYRVLAAKKSLLSLLLFFCPWSDATKVCEEETAGTDPCEGKGGKNKARVRGWYLHHHWNWVANGTWRYWWWTRGGLAGLFAMPGTALDTDVKALDPTSGLDSSTKSDTDHITENFWDDWVSNLDRDDRVSPGKQSSLI